MITRHHNTLDTKSTAIYSPCEAYRYSLTRIWEPEGKRALFIMLNPSTATEAQNDPTVERCERRSRTLGYGAFRVTNIFAFRATDPKVMRAEADPIGPENMQTITESCDWADDIICAWGTHGEHMAQGPAVEALLRGKGVSTKHLGLSKAGHPKHPLYIGYATQPMLWF